MLYAKLIALHGVVFVCTCLVWISCNGVVVCSVGLLLTLLASVTCSIAMVRTLDEFIFASRYWYVRACVCIIIIPSLWL